jgi:hypothetical protein
MDFGFDGEFMAKLKMEKLLNLLGDSGGNITGGEGFEMWSFLSMTSLRNFLGSWVSAKLTDFLDLVEWSLS